MYTAKVITVSDRCYKGVRDDLSGPAVRDLLLEHGFRVDSVTIVPDEKDMIINALNTTVSDEYSLIVTTGGTGFSKRDVTPEATKCVIERETQGISEYMRYESLKITPRSILSRGISGIKNNSLIINLPGSPNAAVENLEPVIETIKHGLQMLLSVESDCAKE